MSIAFESGVDIQEVSAIEGRVLFDQWCQELLSVDAATFLDAYDRGEAYEMWDEAKVDELSVLVPFAR